MMADIVVAWNIDENSANDGFDILKAYRDRNEVAAVSSSRVK